MRDLSYGRYSHGEVLDALRQPVASIGRRYDLLDEGRQKMGELETVSRAPRDALVEHNIDQAVKGSLDLKMGPDERLRGQAYKRFIDPWWQFQMPDGGWVEYQFGRYVWTIPDEDIDFGLGEWQIVLPDQMDIFNTQGPGIDVGYTVYKGARIVDAIHEILDANGITDHSQIQDSDETFDQPRTWLLWEPKDPDHEEYRKIDSELRKRVSGSESEGGGISALAQEMYAIRREQLEAAGIGPTEVGNTTWLSILKDFHRALAWWPPHFDWQGRYVGRSGITAEQMRPDEATMKYSPGPQSIMRGLKKSIDISKFNNIVVVSATNPDGLYFQWAISVDMLDGGTSHPLSIARTGRYTVHSETNSTSDNSEAIFGQAYMRMFEFANTTDKAQWTGHNNPAHEPYDFMILQVPDHPDLVEPTLYHEHMLVVDLNSADMEHGAYKSWIKDPFYGLIGFLAGQLA